MTQIKCSECGRASYSSPRCLLLPVALIVAAAFAIVFVTDPSDDPSVRLTWVGGGLAAIAAGFSVADARNGCRIDMGTLGIVSLGSTIGSSFAVGLAVTNEWVGFYFAAVFLASWAVAEALRLIWRNCRCICKTLMRELECCD